MMSDKQTKDRNGIVETFTAEIAGMCTHCGEAITLVIGSDKPGNSSGSRNYLTNEDADKIIHRTHCRCGKLLQETFVKVQKDGLTYNF